MKDTSTPSTPDQGNYAIRRVLYNTLIAAIDFIRSCIASGQASYTGKAEFYVRRLNGTFEKIGISQLPKPT